MRNEGLEKLNIFFNIKLMLFKKVKGKKGERKFDKY